MSLKVLLADDSMTAQNMGRKILSESGYDVTTVSNGAAAVKKIAEVKPDLVILDIYMPGYSGLEVCERVRANFDTANLPVLLTVGKMEPYRAEDGAKVRADGVIVKPFEATDLLAVVKKLSEKISLVPATHVVEEEPGQEESTFQQFSQPEPAMPSHVEVPDDIAVAPALAMEEFNTSQVAAFAAPAIAWSAPPELEVKHSAPAETHQQFADIPWSFDPPVSREEPVMESAGLLDVGPSPELEFTSAPRVGPMEVAAEPELEAVKGEVRGEAEAEPGLTNAQQITDFATSFGLAQEVESHPVAEEPEGAARAAESGWNGWAHANPEAAGEAKPEGVSDDFDARVAAAMSGFSTEAAEPAREAATGDLAAQPIDDFEARVAAAMSGFATEPVPGVEQPRAVAPEPETHHEVARAEAADDFEARVAAAMSGFGAATARDPVAEAHHDVQEPPEQAGEAAAASSGDDFDARLAEAMAAFEHTPEVMRAEAEAPPKPQDETQEFAVPEPKRAINLNETMVLPQEAGLSLEEEMKQAMGQQAPLVGQTYRGEASGSAPATLSWEPPQPVVVDATAPEPVGEFDPMPVAQEAEPVPHPEPAADQAAVSNPDPSLLRSAGVNGSEKFAAAVHRAIERLKPQLVAEIVKELKGE